MLTSDFDFELPEALIALRPAVPRESARLLAVTPPHFAAHTIADLPHLLKPGDCLVFNDSKVLPARLYGQKGAARIEVLLHKTSGGGLWSAFAKPAKKLQEGDNIYFTDDFSAIVTGRSASGEVLLQFEESGFFEKLQTHGRMPLPPYIEKKRAADAQDATDYQPMLAKHEGSVAAPTASLHFTPTLMQQLAERGVTHETITLHVGAGTFQPVKVEDTSQHIMHAEMAELSATTAERLNAVREKGGRIIAVGSTALRTLESAADEAGKLAPYAGETAIFITPGYRFKAVDGIVTNFHLPKSTLFMLVAAFCGLETMHRAYAYAIAEAFRFYSYGDACLLWPAAGASANFSTNHQSPTTKHQQ